MNEALLARIDSFERTSRTCHQVVLAILSVECLLASLSTPVLAGLYEDFGAKLPPVTSLLIHSWAAWAALAVCLPIVSILVSQKRSASFSLVFSTVAGLVMFVLAQVITVALLLPILQLGAVASG